ncbi:myocyte-specific enhancer factor 2D [Favolaschia claudopus]|uniref:Myocyte-specific enhancer factor 2D n=1 Tax=Favolaschia claudopus TaxID=2862362 RepID=A0AAW0E747_9AGAR
MGRRKIEIQPITHERNRAVTFQKRKNGLFKKAYELGVLCSVDVAVIIFEERPGHHHKLYQYSSTDVREIINRHVQFEGEKDSRGPPDFSGGAIIKNNVDAEGEDDDEADEDEDVPPPTKRTKSKTTKDDEHRSSKSMTIPSPPISIRKLPSTTSKANAIPTSSDRHSARTSSDARPSASKKPRLNSSMSSDEEGSTSTSGLTLPPPTSSSSGGYNFPPMQPYRGGGGGGFGLPSHSFSNFPPLFDSPSSGFRAPQYDPGMYQQLMRTTQQRSANPFGVDWPVHSSSSSSSNNHNNNHHSNHGSGSNGHGSPQVGAQGDPNNWLNFLSGTSPLPSGGSRGGTTSWERGGGSGGGGGGMGDGGGGKRAQSTGSRSGSEPMRSDDKD